MMERSLFILGRQASIGIAELESLYGHDAIEVVSEQCALGNMSVSDVAFDRIGSTVKLGAYLGTLPSSRWQDIKAALSDFVLRCAEDINEGKVQIGLSTYGFRASPQLLMATGLEIKKRLRSHGYSTRLTPNKETSLSSAQVLHNGLTKERGIELLVVRSGDKTIVGRTMAVQDITAYAQRDQGRPKRDAFVGMLPPKLAQTIVNLATAQLPPKPEHIVLDPFCGTGVILQEALLMGYGAYGSDLEARMVEYSKKNLEWLATRGSFADPILEVSDATAHQWRHPFTTVASEVYLGRPLSNWPAPDKLNTIIANCDLIISKFLRNINKQIPAGTRLCLAVPAWISPTNGVIKHLPMLDHLGVLGYNRVSFQQVSAGDLLYYRPGQLVGRELLVLTRSKESN
jgi:tRNA (guanine10-N2)-dimethyltransferase